jgi:hypothetical protein
VGSGQIKADFKNIKKAAAITVAAFMAIIGSCF